MKHISYKAAIVLNKIGFDEYTEDLYMFKKIGIRAVKTENGNTIAERIFHEGDLCPRDLEWDIKYPSAHWIPAPYVFDVVKWLEEYMGIKIIPIYNKQDRTWTYDVDIPEVLSFITYTVNNTASYNSLENMFNYAIESLLSTAYNEQWDKKIEENYWKPIKLKTMEDYVKKLA